VDGDTIVIELYGKQEKVRLIGVDTPETVDPRKAVQYYGKEASSFTRSKLE
jgi:micrococcal nuclease